MRRSRTDLVAVLAIVAGGVIGASLSFSSMLLLRSDDAGVPESVINSYERVRRVEALQSERVEAIVRAWAPVEVERRRISVEVERPRIVTIEVEVNSDGSVWSYRLAGVESGSR